MQAPFSAVSICTTSAKTKYVVLLNLFSCALAS